MANIYSLSVAADTRELRAGQRDLRRFGDQADAAAASTQRLATTAQRASSRAFRPMTGSVQQLGFQIGDFATQVAAGQSAMVAFSQQGSQLAGIFGPGGAVLGAIIAIGGAIGGGLIRSMAGAEESTESLTQRVAGLDDEYRDLNDTIREAIRLEAARESQARQSNIASLESEVALIEHRLSLIQQMEQSERGGLDMTFSRAFGQQVERDAENVEELETRLVELRGEIGVLGLESEQAAGRLEDLLTGGDSSDNADKQAEAIAKQASMVERMVSSLEEEATALTETNRQTALRQALFAGATTDQLRAIAASYDQIEAYESEEQAAKEAAKAEEQAQKARMEAIAEYSDLRLSMIENESERREEMLSRQFTGEMQIIENALNHQIITEEQALQRRNELRRQYDQELAGIQRQSNQVQIDLFSDGWDASLSIIGRSLGQAAELAKEGGRESFESYKNFAAAQAAVSGALAFASVLGEATIPIAARLPLAFTVAGLAAMQVENIQNQEYQGARAAGGSVTAGRDYLVGENGPEIVRMGASGYVVPNGPSEKMMGGSGVNVQNVFQISTGVQGTVRSEIFAMMPLIEQRTTQAVARGISEGGPMARAVGRRS